MSDHSAQGLRPREHPTGRLAIGLVLSALLHGLLLLLRFGLPDAGGGQGNVPLPPLTVKLAPAPPTPPAPEATLPPLADLPAAAPVPSQGMRLVAPGPEPAPAPAPVQALAPPVRKKRATQVRRAPVPVQRGVDVIAQDQVRNEFELPKPVPGSPPDVRAEPAPDEAAAQAREEEAARLAQEQAARDRVAEEQARLDQERAQAAQQVEAERRREAEQNAAAQLAQAQQEAAERLRQQMRQQAEIEQRQQREQKEAKAREQRLRDEARLAEAGRQEDERRRLEARRQDEERRLLEVRRKEEERRLLEASRQDEQRQLAQAQKLAMLQREQQERERDQREREQREREQREREDAARRQADLVRRESEEQARRAAAADIARAEAERRAAAALPAPSAGSPGAARNGAGSGASARQGTGLGPGSGTGLGSVAAERARELARGVDLLGSTPPALRRLDNASDRARRLVVGANERDIPVRMYVDGVRLKIERNGGLAFAPQDPDRVRIDPLVSIALRSDGSVEEVTIVRSSGHARVDDAVRRIIRVNARYSVFPPNIAARYDVIEIRRIWRFAETLTLLEEVP